MRIVIPFLLSLLIFGCYSSETEVIDDYKKMKSYIPSDTSYQYFPFDSTFLITNDLKVDSSIKLLYSEILFHLKEPVLYNKNDSIMRCIRILWLDARRTPIVIRMNDIGNLKYLIRKEFDSTYNGNVGGIIDTVINVDGDFWETVSSSVDSSNFWHERVGNPTDSGKDGILWVLECRFNDRYYFIERWDDGTFSSLLPYSFLGSILNKCKLL